MKPFIDFLDKAKNNAIFDQRYEKKVWTVIFGLFMGIMIICFVIWNRLIRERLPRDIVTGEDTTLKFVVILVSFLIYGISSIFLLNRFQKNLRGIPLTKNKYLAKLTDFVDAFVTARPALKAFFEFILNYIVEAPLYFWRFFYFNSPRKYKAPIILFFRGVGLYIVFHYFSWGCVHTGKQLRFPREMFLIIMLSYLPKIIAYSVFLYEILINRRLEWFYTIAVILLIPLMFTMLRRIWWDVSNYEKESLRNNWITAYVVLPEKVKFRIDKITPEVSDNDYKAAMELYIELDLLLRISEEFYEIGVKYNYIARLLVQILLMLSFLIWLLSLCGIL